MLRGSASAKIDDRGRLKVPADFRRVIEEKYGYEMFVTSVNGKSVRIYQFPVWSEVEQKLAALPSTHPMRAKFSLVINSRGAQTVMDKQGRVLVPPKLRALARMGAEKEVRVVGLQNYLDVWNEEVLRRSVLSKPLTDEDLKILSDAGI